MNTEYGPRFSSDQIRNWKKYERVRKSGKVNMFDARTGARLSRLSNDEYFFCLKNYSELKAQAGASDE